MAITLRIPKTLADRQASRTRRQVRVRKTVVGTTARPRLVVTKSNRHVVAQVIDDSVGRTLVSASSLEAELRASRADKSAKAKQVGELVGQRAQQAGISQVVFDRAGHKYHGRVAALAEGARSAGLGF
jgi:large subunit ribosomal protein L18